MGHTTNPDIRIARSVVDYIFRWMGIRFLAGYQEQHAGLNDKPQVPTPEDSDSQHKPAAMKAGGLNTGKAATLTRSVSEGQTQTRSVIESSASLARSVSEGSSGPVEKTNGNGHANGSNGANGTNGNGHSHAAGKNVEAKKIDTDVLDRPSVDRHSGKLHDTGFSPAVRSDQFSRFQLDAPPCVNCGAITVRNGNCYLCHNCGNSMGCS